MGSEEDFVAACKLLEADQKKGLKKCVLSHEVFKWILENVPKGSRILEFGSGKSSQMLSWLYKVDSVEHDKKYLNKHENVNYIFAPIKDYGKYLWYDIDFLKKSLAEEYFLIIVDGPTSKTGREGFAVNYPILDRYNCPILFDETDRKVEGKILNCFLKSGFEKVFEAEDFAIIKSNKKIGLKKNLVQGLLKNKNLAVCSIGDVPTPKWLENKGDYDVCLIHDGDSNEAKFRLKAFADFFISEKGSKEHNYKVAFEEMPKMKKYENIIYIEDLGITPEELENRFMSNSP